MAREVAKKNKVDLAAVTGTGNFGRVTEDDVLRKLGKPTKKEAPPASGPAPAAAPKVVAAAAPAKAGVAAAPAGVVPMNGMMKSVAKNMEATLSVPVFRVSRVIVTDQFDELYATLKPKGVTVSAMLAKAVGMVLEKHPVVNAAFDPSGAIKYNADINVAMAVALDGGLITPTLRKANTLDIYSLSREWKELVQKAKEKRLTPAEYNTGTFFISNLGMFGVQQFDAILPVGAGSILAIAASLPVVVQMKNGFLGTQKQMIVTLTCDHRHIYGADAANFLKDLAELLENNCNQLLL
jgi:pyruvate dehydrogenase E2 component (dihydrolipoamide acetyltransferase)